jgi:hypothetical protein
MGTLEVDKLDPQSGTALEIGTSGDTVTVPSGVTLTVAGALNVTGTTALADGTVAIAELDIDGGTDIGAAVVAADLFVVDDGAGGTNRKTAASRLTTYILGANSIDSDMYVDGSIDNAHLADDAVGVAELSATGTASSSTFLRGDNSWAAAGGDLSFGGDTFGANKVIGANDAYSLSLETSGNTALTIDANGIITKPLQSAFLGTVGAIANVTGDSTTYTYIAASEVVDRNGDFSTSTFTAPVTGLYHCYVQHNITGLTSSTTGWTSIINTSNRGYYWNMNPYAISGGGTTVGLSHSVIADLDASDTVTFSVDITGGSKVVDTEDTTVMGVFLLG